MSAFTRNDIAQGIKPLCTICAECNIPFFETDIRSYLAACAVRIWSANERGSEDYCEAIDELLGKKPTLAQMITALDCAFDHTPAIPAFFEQLVQRDVQNHTRFSRDMIIAIENELYMLCRTT